MLKYIWGQTATAEMMLIRVAFGWNPSSSLKHIVMHSLSKLFVCMYPVPFKWFFFSFFWPKDVCFALRHWTNNQQDLRVGLGFLQAVILRVLLRHKPSPLNTSFYGEEGKNSFFCLSFSFIQEYRLTKCPLFCATAITKMCTVSQILKEPTAYNHSSFFSPPCLSEDT